MIDKHKQEMERHLKPEYHKEGFAFDPMATFQPKSGPISIYPPPKPIYPMNDIRKERQISNKAYFQELTRKPNNNKPLISNNFYSISNPAFPPLESGRLCLKSDSKPSRSKKKEILESMNSSTVNLGRLEEDKAKNSGSTYRHPIEAGFELPKINEKMMFTPRRDAFKDLEDSGQVKTPTFNSPSDEKIDYIKELCQKIVYPEKKHNDIDMYKLEVMYSKEKTSRDLGKASKLPANSNNNKTERSGPKHIENLVNEPSSASKQSAIGSSISTDFPLLSPPNIQDSVFFRSYVSHDKFQKYQDMNTRKESPVKSNRDHPKIRVRKAGFPKDVFTLKHKK
jgi:hypothetical protein